MITSHDVGTIQYIEWLILIDRAQPSFVAGVSTEYPFSQNWPFTPELQWPRRGKYFVSCRGIHGKPWACNVDGVDSHTKCTK